VASLDPDTAAQVLELLCNLARSRGITLVCSLHQPELARRYFDRILRIENGRAVPVATAAAAASVRKTAHAPC